VLRRSLYDICHALTQLPDLRDGIFSGLLQAGDPISDGIHALPQLAHLTDQSIERRLHPGQSRFRGLGQLYRPLSANKKPPEGGGR